VGLWRFQSLETSGQVSEVFQPEVSIAVPTSQQPRFGGADVISTIPGAGQLSHQPAQEARIRSAQPLSRPLADTARTATAQTTPPLPMSEDAIDPVGEHRVWSPWLRVTEADTVPAWMRCLALILRSSSAPHPAVGTSPSVTASIVRSSLAQI
jgi:hypothetical protein